MAQVTNSPFTKIGQENFCLIHVSLIPVLGVVGEQKIKPTQHSVRELRALGLTPHFLACRSAQPLLEPTKAKLSQFCHVAADNILNIHDAPNIWVFQRRKMEIEICVSYSRLFFSNSFKILIKISEHNYNSRGDWSKAIYKS